MPWRSSRRWKFGICASTPIEPRMANGAGDDPVGHARHHVARRSRAILSTLTVSGMPRFAHPHELGGGKAVLMHHSAGVLEPHQHLVLGPGERQHRGHLLAQRGHGARAHVALEVEHEHPRAVRAALLLAGLRLALAGLGRRLAFPGAEETALEGLLHLAIACPQIADFEPFRPEAAPASRRKNGDKESQGGDGHDDGEGLSARNRPYCNR